MLRFTAVAQRFREKVRGQSATTATPRTSPHPVERPLTAVPAASPVDLNGGPLSPVLAKLIQLAQWGERDRDARRRTAASILAVLAVTGGTYIFVSLPDGHPERVWQEEDFLVFDRITRVPAGESADDAETTADESASMPTGPKAVDPFLVETTVAGVDAAPQLPPDSAWQQPVAWQPSPQIPAQPVSNKMIHSAYYQPSSASAATPRGAWLTGGIEAAESLPLVTAQRPDAPSGPVIQPGPALTRPEASSPAAPATNGPLLVPSLNPLGNP